MPTIFEDLVQPDGEGMRGRITTYCVAESIDRKALELHLRERNTTAPQHSFPDVLYGRYESVRVSPPLPAAAGLAAAALYPGAGSPLPAPAPSTRPPHPAPPSPPPRSPPAR